MFYLIVEKYVGPNTRSAVATIRTAPGRKNMSNAICVDGWLGTTNDTDRHAYGEFETIEAARAAAKELGYTEGLELSDDAGAHVVEIYVSPEAARDQWDAYDWFLNGLGRAGTCAEFGITAETEDDDLEAAIERAIDEARNENAELHGTEALFYELRNQLRDAEFAQ